MTLKKRDDNYACARVLHKKSIAQVKQSFTIAFWRRVRSLLAWVANQSYRYSVIFRGDCARERYGTVISIAKQRQRFSNRSFYQVELYTIMTRPISVRWIDSFHFLLTLLLTRDARVVKGSNMEITVFLICPRRYWRCLWVFGHSAEMRAPTWYREISQWRRNKIGDRTRSMPDGRKSGPRGALICIFNTQSCYDNKMPLNTCSAVRYGLSLDTAGSYFGPFFRIRVVLLREQVTHATDHNRKLPRYAEHVYALAITRFFVYSIRKCHKLAHSKGLAWKS